MFGGSLSRKFLLAEGIIQLVLGFLLLFSTDLTLFLLIQLLGIYWMIRGIFMILQIFFGGERQKGLIFFGGILGVIAGVVVLRYPLFSAFLVLDFLVIMIALVGMIQGSISLYQGLKGKSFGKFLLGIALWLVCLVILFNLTSSVIALPFVVGIIWVASGMGLIAVSFYGRNE